jgi:hypothetical protein
MRLHYKIGEGETIQYVDVMSLYICKYYKFPISQPVIHVGDACKTSRKCYVKREW